MVSLIIQWIFGNGLVGLRPKKILIKCFISSGKILKDLFPFSQIYLE